MHTICRLHEYSLNTRVLCMPFDSMVLAARRVSESWLTLCAVCLCMRGSNEGVQTKFVVVFMRHMIVMDGIYLLVYMYRDSERQKVSFNFSPSFCMCLVGAVFFF